MSSPCVFCGRKPARLVHDKPVCQWCRVHLVKQSEVNDLRRALLDLVEVVATTTVTDMHPFSGPLKRALRVLRKPEDHAA
jgi:hypothetical protein